VGRRAMGSTRGRTTGTLGAFHAVRCSGYFTRPW
jgi:hypothetical protein